MERAPEAIAGMRIVSTLRRRTMRRRRADEDEAEIGGEEVGEFVFNQRFSISPVEQTNSSANRYTSKTRIKMDIPIHMTYAANHINVDHHPLHECRDQPPPNSSSDH